ncbi:monocarboxylate transporter 14-like [Littorina saxatilis]|uniref:monocarboxylate transporter 14-like n=1 Tax=Littorina saxatilis TaxID=31220 RepID=UPI0038B6713B
MSAPTLLTEDKGGYSELTPDNLKVESGVISHDDEDEDDEESLVPDGGWGWAVCAASFMVNFILDGTMFSFGVLLLELLDDLQENKSVTSWVGSAQLGMSMFMGPVVSLMLKRYSIRQVTIAGTLLSAVGFIASVFAPNVYVLIAMYGIVGGTGFSMVFLPAIIVVGLYFSKRRAIATGIATSGSGIGTFAYAYLCDYLLRIFTWRQTVLILAGILLNCVACGLVFRPLVPARKRKRRKGGHSACKGGGSSSSSDCSTFCESESGESTAMMKRGRGGGRSKASMETPDWLLHQSTTGLADAGRMVKNNPSSPSPGLVSICLLQAQPLRNSRHQHHRRNSHHRTKALFNAIYHNAKACENEDKNALPPTLAPDDRLYRSVEDFERHKLKPAVSNLDDKLLYFSETQLVQSPPQERAPEKNHITKGLMRPILRKDIYYSGSISHLAEYQKCGRSMTSFLAHMTQPGSDDSSGSVTTCSSERSGSGKGHVGRLCENMMRGVFDLRLFRNKAFLLLLVAFTMWTVQSVPLTYLPDMAVSKGVPRQQAAFLISIVGITNTIGRIIAGVISDMVRIRCIWLYVGALLVAAAINFALPWCDTFPMLASAAAAFGLCMAVAVSMRTIVLAEQLGIAVLTKAFGMVALFQGVAFTVNPPIAGKLFDLTGSYDWPFTMSAAMYLLSGLSSLAVGLWFKPRLTSPTVIIRVEEVMSSDSSSSDSTPR